MLVKVDDQTQKTVSRNEQRLMILALTISIAGIIYLILSSGPKFYSFEEYERAKVACGDDFSENCQIRALKSWRKANPDAPSGSKP